MSKKKIDMKKKELVNIGTSTISSLLSDYIKNYHFINSKINPVKQAN